MQSESLFDDIRPYRDEEVPAVMQRLIKDPQFDKVLLTLFDTPEKVAEVKIGLSNLRSVRDFQGGYIVPLLQRIIKNSTDGVTLGGLEHIDPNKNYLFISNHRDIILDSAFLNGLLFEKGLKATEIAIGSNLLIYPWIKDLVKVNRSFVVKRNIPVKQMLEASKVLSEYIRTTIAGNGDSIWLAQREGRTKNGNDQTQVSLLKMLNMSNENSFANGFEELNIVPLAISYEIEPCGNEKVAELLCRQNDPSFQKTEGDDLWSMGSGLKNHKGHIHFQFGKPVDGADMKKIALAGNNNKCLKALAERIDQCIYRNYKLWPNNYVAYDVLNNTDKYQVHYTEADKTAFLSLTHERLKLVDADREDAMILWLEMYATPVVNAEQSAGDEAVN